MEYCQANCSRKPFISVDAIFDELTKLINCDALHQPQAMNAAELFRSALAIDLIILILFLSLVDVLLLSNATAVMTYALMCVHMQLLRLCAFMQSLVCIHACHD